MIGLVKNNELGSRIVCPMLKRGVAQINRRHLAFHAFHRHIIGLGKRRYTSSNTPARILEIVSLIAKPNPP